MAPLLHTHILCAFLYVLSYTFKVIFLLSGNEKLLTGYRKFADIIERIFALGFLATGFYMLYDSWPVPSWVHLKVLLVLIAIPLGLVGFRDKNKIMAILSSIIFLGVLVHAISELLN